MKRPVVLIVGAAVGALLVAAAGASAHSGISLATVVNSHTTVFGDDATSARVEPAESPEPTESPEAPPTAEPTEKPEPPEAAEPAENQNENNNDDDQNEHNQGTQPEGGGGDHHSGGGDG
jgi:outer membrane biosynthesis protein TonB